MGKVMKLMLVGLVVVGLVGMAVSIFAQEKTEIPKATQVSSEIVSVDLVKSEVVVKKVKDELLGTYENITFKVSPETKISKKDAVLKLSDLKVADKVTVSYTTDEKGNQKVETIEVKAE